jgi:RNA polymerase sigma-70 factor (ECF subfamily)
MDKDARFTEHQTNSAHLTNRKHELNTSKELLQKRQDSLTARLRVGNRSAAAELVEMYYERIYLYMRRLGHTRQVSEDLTQETFLQAWYHIGQLRDGKALNGWLYRIAGNVSNLYWRKRKGRTPVNMETIDVPDGSKVGAEKAGHREQLSKLQNAVNRLPWKFRRVIILHYMQHMSIAEGAEAAGIRQGTFKSRLSRALKMLRKHVT